MKRSCLGALLSVLVIFVVIIAVIISLGSNTDSDYKAADSTQSTQSTQEKQTSTEKTKVTETVEQELTADHLEQSSDTWKMTYTGYEITDELDIFTTAKEGTEFVIVYFEIENTTDEDQVFSTLLAAYGEFYIDSYKVSQVLYSAMRNNAYQLFSVPVEAGRKAKGYFLFQTESDWHTLEISYDDDLWGDGENKMSFTFTKN